MADAEALIVDVVNVNLNQQIQIASIHQLTLTLMLSPTLETKLSMISGGLQLQSTQLEPESSDPYKRIRRIILEYLQLHGRGATWQKLIDVLRACQLNHAADTLQNLANLAIENDQDDGLMWWRDTFQTGPAGYYISSVAIPVFTFLLIATAAIFFSIGRWSVLCASPNSYNSLTNCVKCQPCEPATRLEVPPEPGIEFETTTQSTFQIPNAIQAPNSGQFHGHPRGTTSSYINIIVTDPNQIIKRNSNQLFNITIDFRQGKKWDNFRYPNIGEGSEISGQDKVAMIGSTTYQNIHSVMCKAANSTMTLAYSRLVLNLKNHNDICSGSSNNNNACNGVVMPHLQELQVFGLGMRSSTCIFEILQPFKFPRLGRISLHGLEVSGYNVGTLWEIFKKVAPTLRVLELRDMESVHDPGIAIVTNEICEKFVSDFKILIDWRNTNPEYRNSIANIRAHPKCVRFLSS